VPGGEGEPDAGIRFGGTGGREDDVIDTPVGRDCGQAALGEDEDERNGHARRGEDLAQGLRAGEILASIHKYEVAGGRGDERSR